MQDLLSHLEGVEDCVPKVQMPASAFDFESGAPPHSALSYDSRQFGTSYDKDLKTFQDVDLLVEQGSHLCGVVYAFRSISRAIPTLREKKSEKYVKAFCLFIRLLPPPICSSFFAYFGGLAQHCMASHCDNSVTASSKELSCAYVLNIQHICYTYSPVAPIIPPFLCILCIPPQKNRNLPQNI